MRQTRRMKNGTGATARLFSVVIMAAVLVSLIGVGIFSQPVQADASLMARVTLVERVISVTISDGYPTAVDYGSLHLGEESTPVTYTPSTYDYLRVENSGNVVEDLMIKGDVMFGPYVSWVLTPAPATDQYSHLFGIGQDPSTYTALSYLETTLGDNVAAGGTVDFNLKIQMPTAAGDLGNCHTFVFVMAVAA